MNTSADQSPLSIEERQLIAGDLHNIFVRHAHDNAPVFRVARALTAHPQALNLFPTATHARLALLTIEAQDYAFERNGGAYFHLQETPAENADAFTAMHIEDYRRSIRPSIPALVTHHLDDIGLSPDSTLYQAAMLVAARAEVMQLETPEYHNPYHVEDVIAQVAEFAKLNNKLAKQDVAGFREFSTDKMAEAIIAAVIHDLDHPGGKNALPGEKKAADIYRLENASLAAGVPLLYEAGLGQSSINDICTMVRVTSPDGPLGLIKRLAKAHHTGESLTWEQVDPENKFPELCGLLDNAELAELSAIVEDADLGASAFYGLQACDVMSDVLTKEWQRRNYPDDLHGPKAREGFGKYVVGEGPASRAAQHAVGANFTEMMVATRQELALTL